MISIAPVAKSALWRPVMVRMLLPASIPTLGVIVTVKVLSWQGAAVLCEITLEQK